MKKLINTLFALSILTSGMAQVTADILEFTPDQEIKIIVDLTQTSNDWDIMTISETEDLYIWTWKPTEHGASHPLTNGIGGAPWKNSNPALKMTKEADYIYSFTMTPTLFYETDAGTVYNEDIHFLVKPEDGGGYGDPDRKTEDLSLAVDPVIIIKNPLFSFPSLPNDDDVFTLVYENFREDKPSMQNLNSDEVYFSAECTTVDSITYVYANFFTIGNYPELQMISKGDGLFTKRFIPRDFFGIPNDKQIASMKFAILRWPYLTGTDRIDEDHEVDISCD